MATSSLFSDQLTLTLGFERWTPPGSGATRGTVEPVTPRGDARRSAFMSSRGETHPMFDDNTILRAVALGAALESVEHINARSRESVQAVRVALVPFWRLITPPLQLSSLDSAQTFPISCATCASMAMFSSTIFVLRSTVRRRSQVSCQHVPH